MKPTAEPCWHWRRRVTLLAAGALHDHKADTVLAHIDTCPGCWALFSQVEALSETLEPFAQQLPPDRPSPSLRERWQSAVVAEPHAGGQPRPTHPSLLGLEPLTDWLPGGRRAGFAIAACWILVVLLQLSAPRVATPTATTPHVPPREILSVLQPRTLKPPALAQPNPTLAPPRPSASGILGYEPLMESPRIRPTLARQEGAFHGDHAAGKPA